MRGSTEQQCDRALPCRPSPRRGRAWQYADCTPKNAQGPPAAPARRQQLETECVGPGTVRWGPAALSLQKQRRRFSQQIWCEADGRWRKATMRPSATAHAAVPVRSLLGVFFVCCLYSVMQNCEGSLSRDKFLS
jgi:hypothetical protein